MHEHSTIIIKLLKIITTGFLTNEILMKNSNFMESTYENVMKWTHEVFIAL